MYALDRVKETSSTSGTGTFSLAGAVSGFRSFASVAGADGRKVTYVADDGAGNWEVGYGTFADGSPDTLTRDVVLASSNSGSKVSFSGATLTISATKAALFDGMLGSLLYSGTLTGGPADYSLSIYPAPPAALLAALPDFTRLRVRVNVANTAATGKPTIQLNGGSGPTFQVTKNGGQQLAAGDMALNSILELSKFGSTLEIVGVVPPAFAIPSEYVTGAMILNGTITPTELSADATRLVIPFAAGYDGTWTPKDLVLNQTYGKIKIDHAGSIGTAIGTIETGPTSADALFDILLNGSSIYASVKAKFAAGTTTFTAGTLTTTTVARGDVLSLKCTQIGSSVKGKGVLISLPIYLT